MRCNDCGETEAEPSRMGDVCVDCLELRMQLVTAMESQAIGIDEFQELQRAIARGDGQGANAIRRTLGLTAPEI